MQTASSNSNTEQIKKRQKIRLDKMHPFVNNLHKALQTFEIRTLCWMLWRGDYMKVGLIYSLKGLKQKSEFQYEYITNIRLLH